MVLPSHYPTLDLYRVVELGLSLSDIEPEERVGLRGYRLDVRLDIQAVPSVQVLVVELDG